MPPFRRSSAGSSALARRHLRILGNRPTAAILPANRLPPASDHRAHAALQPADCLLLLPQRLPAAVETPIARPTTPPTAPHSDGFVHPSLRTRKGSANSDSFGCR